MNKRDLARALSRLGFSAMPAAEARKFSRVLGGPVRSRPGFRSLPGDGLPPVTVPERAPRPVQRLSRPECGWYYGEPCGCGRGHEKNQPKSKPEQMRLL